MREKGLQRAIDAAGGVGALARMLGIAQPSVSAWTRVPADRVAAVEAAVGVPRSDLRPDLFDGASNSHPDLDDVDLARARTYRLLANVLARPPSQALLERIAKVTGDATPLGLTRIALADAARATSEAAAGEEFFKVFIGVGRGEVLPYASYYLAGFLHERPLAAVRADLARLGIERRPDIYEPEDGIATLLDVMAGLIDGSYGAAKLEQDAFFETHLKPWAQKLFADISVAPSASFYRAVARLGLQWVEIETRAFAIAA
jgi:TorA maturation chaperone TorD